MDEGKELEEIHAEAIRLTGLAECLCGHMNNSITYPDTLQDAQQLAWAYEAMATLAHRLADKLSAIAP